MTLALSGLSKRSATARSALTMPSSLLSCGAVRAAVAVLFFFINVTGVQAGEVRAAVATNFSAPMKELIQAFESLSKHKVIVSFGSTGVLFAQLTQGASFDVFLAADQKRPTQATVNGLAVKGSQITYAVGRLALYCAHPEIELDADYLAQGEFERLAIANPATAPYGVAAMQVIASLGAGDDVSSRIVRGNNVAQAYQFVASGAAELGLIANSQIALNTDGSRWLVPEELHQPIAQDAVLLSGAENNPAANQFMAWLAGAQARAIIRRFGYQDAAPSGSKKNNPDDGPGWSER